ncbi:amidohydrolase [Catalinimonas niigatensis]|uniref:amidohydrolase n=1 Tax=Catalinimonas niigatensis TaxID=1397264 RepID=UPI002665A1DB|nr:amidohydrolase [Catalinimonas niigatensis]WPP48065.1 amidohydrolase [Catalinimonas niigatensis]
MTQDSDVLKISLIQTSLYWQNIDANLGMLEEKIWHIDEKTDLIVLPEMFTTGFTNAAKDLAEPMNSKTFRWMKQQAMQTKAVVCGSFIARDGKDMYNRLLWMRPDGEYATYDKKHLFRMSEEHEIYSAGQDRVVVEWKGWKIRPLICYDLRFPIWSRNETDADGYLAYDLLLYVANWPAARVYVWQSLLQARAIENLSYCVGVNRVGEDDMGITYNGHSLLFNYKGEVMNDLEETEKIITFALHKSELSAFRKKFPAHLDADAFRLGK